MTARIVEGFAGAGGFSEGARLIGLGPCLGYELDADACATARAAGHARVQADVRLIEPVAFAGADGWVSGPPCPTYADSGKRTGRNDASRVRAAIPQVADAGPDAANLVLDGVAAAVTDPRTALVLHTLDLALSLPSLRWLIAEQVPAVRGIWQDMAAELAAMHRWDFCTVLTLRADDFGAATRRTRVFLIATRDRRPDLAGLPYRRRWDCGRFSAPAEHPPNLFGARPATSMAAALDWPAGVRVNTRGRRTTAGGNEFPADGPALSLTGNGARCWYRTDCEPAAGRLHPWQAGLLQTFPRAYPWQGSRSSQFQRIADAVPPVMAAAVLGAAAGQPWRRAITRHLAGIYPRPTAPPDPIQLDLFTPAEGAAA